MEGTTASVPPQGGRKHPQQEFLQVDTTNILFICGGAFAGPRKDHRRPPAGQVDRLRRACRRARGAAHRRDAEVDRARGSAEVRPDPGVHRPTAGHRHARGPRRGSAGQDPGRAEERAGEAVSEAVRHGGCRAGLLRRGAARGRQARRSSARPAPAASARSSKASCSTRCSTCLRWTASTRSMSTRTWSTGRKDPVRVYAKKDKTASGGDARLSVATAAAGTAVRRQLPEIPSGAAARAAPGLARRSCTGWAAQHCPAASRWRRCQRADRPTLADRRNSR